MDIIRTVDIDEDSIIKVIKSLIISKAHGFDEIFTYLLKICYSTISKPPLMIFENFINQGEFPDVWKKANVVPVHKKLASNL